MRIAQGYFATPAPQPTAGAAPVKAAAASVTFGQDAYGASPAVAVGNVAPLLPGVAAGIRGYGGVVGAKVSYRKASRSRSWEKKIAAPTTSRGHVISGVIGSIKSSLLFGALVSIGLNGYGVAKGQLTVAQAGANVAGDTAAAAAGGLAGGVLSMVGTALLVGPMGIGFGLNLVGLGLGVAGYMVGETLFRQSTWYGQLRAKASTAIARVTG